jgi:hypothetical protein
VGNGCAGERALVTHDKWRLGLVTGKGPYELQITASPGGGESRIWSEMDDGNTGLRANARYLKSVDRHNQWIVSAFIATSGMSSLHHSSSSHSVAIQFAGADE